MGSGPWLRTNDLNCYARSEIIEGLFQNVTKINTCKKKMLENVFLYYNI